MKDTRKVKIKKERTVRTYAELWLTSNCLLMRGQENKEASFHQYMASLVFTAFALEAYLNHIGAKIFKCWTDLERLSPKEKINVIAEHLDVQVDYGKRPWQIMKKLFGFRNDIAHGKSVKVKSEEVILLINHKNEDLHKFVLTSWEKFCTERNAVKAREDVENIIETIHKASGIKGEYPFLFGMNFGSATLIK